MRECRKSGSVGRAVGTPITAAFTRQVDLNLFLQMLILKQGPAVKDSGNLQNKKRRPLKTAFGKIVDFLDLLISIGKAKNPS